MKILTSAIDKQPLTDAQITNALFVSDPPERTSCIIILGAHEHARADKAAELYWHSYSRKIVVTGGCPEKGIRKAGSGITEARFLVNYLAALGVEEQDIIMEEQSTNTIENIKNGMQIARDNLGEIESVGFISIPLHMLRVKLTAIKLGIENARFYPDARAFMKQTWTHSEKNRQHVYKEVEKIGLYTRKGDLANIEIDI